MKYISGNWNNLSLKFAEIDEYKSFMSDATGGDVSVSSLDFDNFKVEMSCLQHDGNVIFGKAKYGTGVRINKIRVKNDWIISVPYSGSELFYLGRNRIDTNNNKAAIIDIERCDEIEFSGTTQNISLVIAKFESINILESIFERSVPASLNLQLNFDPRSDVGLMLSNIMQAIDEGSRGMSPNGPLAQSILSLRLAAITTVLERLPHSLSHWFDTAPREPAPWQIRKAIELILARTQDSISIHDLARELGIGVRALQLGFRRHTDHTPHGFMRREALNAARRELQTGAVSVSDVARRWGFLNTGRFAAEYKRFFGENPSETRRS